MDKHKQKRAWLVLGTILTTAMLIGAGCNRMADTDATEDNPSITTNRSGTASDLPANASDQPVAVDTPATKPKTTTVSYTATGFSPESITIKMGDTVKFVNNSGSGMWPAAGPHPVHTSVPGFDAKRMIPAGDSYSFTFTKAQQVSYHNHLNPMQIGKIIVE